MRRQVELLKEKIRRKMTYFGLIIVAAILMLQSPSNPLTQGNSYTDSSVFRYVAYEMIGGSIPYVDTFDHKGPLIYLINILGIKIGFTHGIWALELFSLCITFWMSYYFLKKYTADNFVAAFSVITAYSFISVMFDGGNTVEEWALPFIALSVFLFWEYYANSKISFIKIFLTGICCGCVLMMRPNMAVLWVVNGLAIIIDLLSSRQWKRFVQYISCFLGGCLLVVLPILVYFLLNNALDAFWNCYILFNVQYSGNHWLQKIKVTLYFLNKPQIYICLAAVLYGIMHSQSKRTRKSMIILGATIFFSLLSVGMSGRYYFHYQMILLPLILLPVFILVKQCRTGINEGFSVNNIIIFIFSVFLVSNLSNAVSGFAEIMQEEGRNARIYDISQYIAENTNPDDKISVFGNEDIIYLRSRRKSTSRYSYQVPIMFEDERIMEEYFSEIQNSIPQIIVIATQMDSLEMIEKMSEFCYNNNYEKVIIEETTLFKKN